MGYLARYGSRLKTETENGVFLQQYGKRFSLKNGKRYGFRLRCRGFLSPNRGNGRSRNGRVQYGTVRYGTVWFGSVRFGSVRYGTVRYGPVRVTNSDALLYHFYLIKCDTLI